MCRNKNQIGLGEKRLVWNAENIAAMKNQIKSEIKDKKHLNLKSKIDSLHTQDHTEKIYWSKQERKNFTQELQQQLGNNPDAVKILELISHEIKNELFETKMDKTVKDYEGSDRTQKQKDENKTRNIIENTHAIHTRGLNPDQRTELETFINKKLKEAYEGGGWLGNQVTKKEAVAIAKSIQSQAKEIKNGKIEAAPVEVSAVADLLDRLATKENKDIVTSTLDSVEAEIDKQNLGLKIDRKAFKDAAMQIAATELANLQKADQGIPDTKELITLQTLKNQRTQLKLRLKATYVKSKPSLAIATSEVQEAERKHFAEIKTIVTAIKAKEAEIKAATAYKKLAKSTSLKEGAFTFFEHSKVENRAKDLQKKIEAKVTQELIEPAQKILPEIEKLKKEGLELPTDKKLSTTEIIKAVGNAQGIITIRDDKIQPALVTEYLAKNNNVIENIKGIFLEKLWDVKLESSIKSFAAGLGLSSEIDKAKILPLLKKTDTTKLGELQKIVTKVTTLQNTLSQSFPGSGELMKDSKVLAALQGLIGIDFAKGGRLDVTALINIRETDLVMLDTNLDHLLDGAKKIIVINTIFSGKDSGDSLMKELTAKMDLKNELPKILENSEQAENLIIKKAQKVLGIENEAFVGIEDLQNFVQTQIDNTKKSIEKHQGALTKLFAHINPQLTKFGATLPSLESLMEPEKDNKQYSFEQLVQVLQTREITEAMLVGGILEKLGLQDEIQAETIEELKQAFDTKLDEFNKKLDEGITTLIKKGIPAFMSEKFKLSKKDQSELENIELDAETLQKLKQQFLPLISDFLKSDNSKFEAGILDANGVINITLAMQALDEPKIAKFIKLSSSGDDLEKTLAKGEKDFDSTEEGKDEKAVKNMVVDMSKFIMKEETPATKEIHAAVSEKIPVAIKGKIAISEVKGAFGEAMDAWQKKGGLEGIFAAITIFFTKFGEIFEKMSSMFKGTFDKLKKPFIKTAEKIYDAAGPGLQKHIPPSVRKMLEAKHKPMKDSLREVFGLDETSITNISQNKALTMEILMDSKADLTKIKIEHGINTNTNLASLVKHIQTNETEKYISKDHSKQTVWEFLRDRSPSYFPAKKEQAVTPAVKTESNKPEDTGMPEAAKKVLDRVGNNAKAPK